jgi:hypothetical protein
MHRSMTSTPLAYFITLRTYATWLHGDERGSVSPKHNEYGTPRLPPNPAQAQSEADRAANAPCLLNVASTELVERTITEVCQHRDWHLFAVKARTNHVHIVVSAGHTPERVMNDFKAWCTRRLREASHIAPAQDVWADHGSTPYL